MDGKKVTKFGELQEVMAQHKPGDKVVISYLRDKKSKKATVTLRNAQGTTNVIENFDDEELGIGLRALTEVEKREFGVKHGIYVTAVRDGKMKDAGVFKGLIITNVNGTDIDSTEDFYQQVREANKSSERVLWIKARSQTGTPRSFAVELEGKSNK